MVIIEFDPNFKRRVKKISDKPLKGRVKKQIKRIVENPGIGKPMRFSRRGTREVYVKPFRLSYATIGDGVIFLELYHKDEQ